MFHVSGPNAISTCSLGDNDVVDDCVDDRVETCDKANNDVVDDFSLNFDDGADDVADDFAAEFEFGLIWSFGMKKITTISIQRSKI